MLIRHAESEWNVLGKWTGRTDVHLSETGKLQSGQLGGIIADIEFHHAYTSEQIRTVETLVGILEAADRQVSHTPHPELNERDYGEYTGLNKWDVLEQLGEDVFTKIRRGWDHPIPEGETLQMVYRRVVPFYQTYILSRLERGENILIVSHGNTLRSLIKYLEDISDTGIEEVEAQFGEVYIYQVDRLGKKHGKAVRTINQ